MAIRLIRNEFSLNTAESLFSSCDNSIPVKDKSLWRDEAVAVAYAVARSSLPSTPNLADAGFKSEVN